MATLRLLHQMMNERRMVRLSDGRIGKIVRVDTTFPDNATTVSIWTASDAADAPNSAPGSGPGISKVALNDIVGEESREAS